MHALYILTVQSAYNSSIVYSPKSYTEDSEMAPVYVKQE